MRTNCRRVLFFVYQNKKRTETAYNERKHSFLLFYFFIKKVHLKIRLECKSQISFNSKAKENGFKLYYIRLNKY